MAPTGHVFVVRGRIENLDCDAFILPTDDAFSVEPKWMTALGRPSADEPEDDDVWMADALALTPSEWSVRGWGRAQSDVPEIPLLSPTWFVDSAAYGSTGDMSQSLDAMIDRVRSVLNDIASTTDLKPGSGRPRPLVALPTLGVSGGGFDQMRGNVIDQLLSVCEEVAGAAGIDVVIVAARRSDHAAFQARRRSTSSQDSSHLTSDALAIATAIADRAREGSLALFLGAGVSMSAGLPSWDALINTLAGEVDIDFGRVTSALDKAELLQRELGCELGKRVAEVVRSTHRYGLNHALLAALEIEQSVTTNYDDLYERAVNDGGRGVLPILPFSPTLPRSPWLLKMHGDAEHPSTIVLSRSDFVGYDSRSRPMGSVVQALLLTKHLFVVGASMTDDNFLRLAHEVVAFKESGQEAGVGHSNEPLGTVLAMRADPAAARLWRGRLDYVAASTSAEEEDPGVLARQVAIFLDTVAMYATPGNHLADERYDMLLDDRSRSVARAARELRSLIDDLPASEPTWLQLDQALGDIGA